MVEEKSVWKKHVETFVKFHKIYLHHRFPLIIPLLKNYSCSVQMFELFSKNNREYSLFSTREN